MLVLLVHLYPMLQVHVDEILLGDVMDQMEEHLLLRQHVTRQMQHVQSLEFVALFQQIVPTVLQQIMDLCRVELQDNGHVMVLMADELLLHVLLRMQHVHVLLHDTLLPQMELVIQSFRHRLDGVQHGMLVMPHEQILQT